MKNKRKLLVRFAMNFAPAADVKETMIIIKGGQK